eukprot:3196271-Pyramimonas_sp.AAC.1
MNWLTTAATHETDDTRSRPSVEEQLRQTRRGPLSATFSYFNQLDCLVVFAAACDDLEALA